MQIGFLTGLKSLQKALKGKTGFITVKVNVRTLWISAAADPEMGVSSWVKSLLPTGFGLGLFIWNFVIAILFLSWYQGYNGWLISSSQLLWISCITGRISPSWICPENKAFFFYCDQPQKVDYPGSATVESTLRRAYEVIIRFLSAKLQNVQLPWIYLQYFFAWFQTPAKFLPWI